MRLTLLLAAIVSVAAAGVADAAGRHTEECNSNFADGVIVAIAVEEKDDFVRIASRPGGKGSAAYRLWNPIEVEDLGFSFGPLGWVLLRYEPTQDTEQIADEIAADPALTDLGVVNVETNSLYCWVLMPPAGRVTLTEYYNRKLDRYELSGSPQESQRLERGGAWKRTGEVMVPMVPDGCWGSKPVHRFYSAASGSFRHTVDAQQCGDLRRDYRRWEYRGEVFGGRPPLQGGCPWSYVPMWRLRKTGLQYNERLVTRPELRDEMVARGWIDDGVAMCLAQWQ